MNIKYETLSGMALFKDAILDSYILHIPHASTDIPKLDGFLLDRLEKDLYLLTDWATDRIFDVDGIEKIVTPYSRLFCDVERLEDASEPMLQVGRGFFYTHGYDGSELRQLDQELKDVVYRDYYQKHHELFYEKAKERLEKHGVCYIMDCHSFNDHPEVPFLDQPKSPDICIGTDPFHTPDYLLNYTLNYFSRLGYSVEVNNPYAGCIIPKPYFLKNDQVMGIMVEINKRLYMDDNSVNDEKVEQLRKQMSGYFSNL